MNFIGWLLVVVLGLTFRIGLTGGILLSKITYNALTST